MKKILINNKEKFTSETKLKRLLIDTGMHFPCDGKGICGRCRIVCNELLPTELDKKFLSHSQLQEGLRLACDKEIKDGIKVFFEESQKQQSYKKLDFCNIAVSLDNHKIKIGILDDEIAEEHVIENKVNESKNNKIYLRSAIAKESVELFEKYGVAKAETVAVSTDSFHAEILLDRKTDGLGELLDASEYMIPAQSLYILPFVNEVIGGDYISFSALQKADCVVIKAESDFVAGLLTDEEMLCLYHKNVNYDDNDVIAIETSIKYLLKNADRPPVFKLYGSKAQSLISILMDYSYVIEDSDVIIKTIASSINDNRLKNRIFKLRKKISIMETVENEEWQELFNLSANNTHDCHSAIFKD